MKDPESDRITELTAEQQRIRADRTIPRETKAARLGDLQSEIARLTAMRNAEHAQRTNGMSPVEQWLQRW